VRSFQSAYDGWYQDESGEWHPVEDTAAATTAQPAKAANGSVVKSSAAEASDATSKASSQVKT
jgi:hypothetical protein